MSLCVVSAGFVLTLAASSFTLAWTHSVERTRWEERWRVAPEGLVLELARVAGSGAGMDPAEGAVLRDGWWEYRPDPKPRREVVLAASGATGSGWTLCAAEACREVGAAAGEPIVLRACPDPR